MTGKEIEVGEYVRTIYGYIAKIIKIDDTFIWCDCDVYYDSSLIQLENRECGCTYKDIILKHSSNIIDLIEVGDYVNGMLVVNIVQFSDEINSCFKQILVNRDKDCTLPPLRISEEDIETILTKEQYQDNCYIVESEE